MLHEPSDLTVAAFEYFEALPAPNAESIFDLAALVRHETLITEFAKLKATVHDFHIQSTPDSFAITPDFKRDPPDKRIANLGAIFFETSWNLRTLKGWKRRK